MTSLVVLVALRPPRSKRIAEALRAGGKRMGWRVEVTDQDHDKPRGDICAAYGWRHRGTFEAYRAAGQHYVYIDLGYWRRKRSAGDYNGNHKVSVDARHPTAYFRKNRSHDRMAGAPELKPWKSDGSEIVIAGSSAKGAITTGRRPMAWEHETIKILRRVTARPLVYRPKPSWHDARPIPGIRFSSGEESIETALRNAWALATFDSNAALDAIAAGVPIYAAGGVASVFSIPSLNDIETPLKPSDKERKQLLADVGYCHWTREEIASGMVFDLLKSDGLLS